jgi:hypothetical protein
MYLTHQIKSYGEFKKRRVCRRFVCCDDGCHSFIINYIRCKMSEEKRELIGTYIQAVLIVLTFIYITR